MNAEKGLIDKSTNHSAVLDESRSRGGRSLTASQCYQSQFLSVFLNSRVHDHDHLFHRLSELNALPLTE